MAISAGSILTIYISRPKLPNQGITNKFNEREFLWKSVATHVNASSTCKKADITNDIHLLVILTAKKCLSARGTAAAPAATVLSAATSLCRTPALAGLAALNGTASAAPAGGTLY